MAIRNKNLRNLRNSNNGENKEVNTKINKRNSEITKKSKDFPKNRQLIAVWYLKKYQTKDKKHDMIIIISKDKDGNKYFDEYKDPEFSYYVTKKEYWEDDDKERNSGTVVNNKLKIKSCIERDKVDLVTCKYSELLESMLSDINDKGYNSLYSKYIKIEDIKEKNSKLRELQQELHLDYRFHCSDKNIEDYYIRKFLEVNPPNENLYEITKTFYDIEVDSSEISGFPDPEKAECPINIISLFDYNNVKCHIFKLKYDNKTYLESLSNQKEIEERTRQKYIEFEKELNMEIDFQFYEFDNELDLIWEFFDVINEIKPDYNSAWNTGFDLTTLYNRIKKLGYEPEDIMCPKEFNEKLAYIVLDKKSTDPADRSDNYYIVSYTNNIDLMALYANITKPFGKKESYSLDAIGEEETGQRKNELETNIKTIHLDNYTNFEEYNIQDTMVLMYIDHKTKHIDLLHSMAMTTTTRPSKTLKKTVCLRNYAEIFYEKYDMIISNNHSRIKDKVDGKIPGALAN